MNKLIWTGRILSGLTGILVLTSGINVAVVRSADLIQSFAAFGYPRDVMTPIGLAALVASLLYLIPRIAVLGAILLTGYLGGAVATHVRIHDPTFFAPLTAGILAWLGLYLRDEQLRALLPLRS